MRAQLCAKQVEHHLAVLPGPFAPDMQPIQGNAGKLTGLRHQDVERPWRLTLDPHELFARQNGGVDSAQS